MTLFLILLYLLVIGCLWRSKNRFYGKYILLFTTLWFANMTMMAFDVCDVGGISNETMIIILSSVMLYILGYSILTSNQPYKAVNKSVAIIDKRVDSFVRNKAFLFFCAIVNVYVLFQLLLVLPILIAQGNMSGMRGDALLGVLYSSTFYTLNSYLLSPFYNISLPLAGYLLITKKNKIALNLTMFYCILYPSLFGGRLAFFVIGLAVIVIYLWCKSSSLKLVNENLKRTIMSLIVTIVALFSIMTVAKSGDVSNINSSLEDLKEDMIQQPLRYFVCPQKAFEYAIEHDYPSKLGGYMHGRATLACVDYYVNPIINSTQGLHNPNVNSKIGYLIQDQWISFSNSVPSWNALYTALLHFYLDFGVIGCFLFSFIFGALSRWTINLLSTKASLPVLFLTFFVLSKSILSFFSFQPVGGDVLPFLLYILIWYIFEKKVYEPFSTTGSLH